MKKGAAYWMDLKQFDDEDPVFLAQVQKGITNFVRILTEKEIPVEYATTGDSLTDGKTVYIASNIKEDTIDHTVGLALHEASHVLLTDFDYLTQKKGSVLRRKYNIPHEDWGNVFTLINFIEDKRIDNYVYTTAPGYQFYYEELYRKFFYNEIVDKNLKLDIFTKPTWDSYFFRIINIFNKNSNLDALCGLKEVYEVIDVKHIDRLKSTYDSVKVAVEIYNIIKSYILVGDEIPSAEDMYKEHKIKEHLERQKDFINSNYRKKRVKKGKKLQIQKLADYKTDLKQYNISQNSSIPVIITKNWGNYFKSPHNYHEDAVGKGFFNGKKLLSKLKVRNSTKKDIFENQKKGKLNSRKLHKAPFENNLFYKIEKEGYKNTFIHISLDLSGSMRGEKLTQTIQTAVAIAYTACNLKNFDVEITLRGTEHIPTSRNNSQCPLLAYFFDSRKDSVKKLNELKYLTLHGMTPEGICLDEIRKKLPRVNHYNEVYLLNISDGLPNINDNYKSTTAINHTKKVVNSIKSDKVGVLSYYIHDTWDKTQKSKDSFIEMYGKDAKFIDVNNISMIAKSINNLLLRNTLKVF